MFLCSLSRVPHGSRAPLTRFGTQLQLGIAHSKVGHDSRHDWSAIRETTPGQFDGVP